MPFFKSFATGGKNNGDWRQAGTAIAQIEPAGTEALIAMIDDPAVLHGETRIAAFLMLVECDSDADNVIQRLKRGTNAQIPWARVLAAMSLARRSEVDDKVLTILSNAMEDSATRGGVVQILKFLRANIGWFSPRATWLTLIKDAEIDVQMAIVSTLSEIDGEVLKSKPELIPGLLKLCDNPDAGVRRKSIDVLTHFVAARPEVQSRLRQALNDPDQEVRAAAIQAVAVFDTNQEFGGLVTQTAVGDYVGAALKSSLLRIVYELRYPDEPVPDPEFSGFGGGDAGSSEGLPALPWPPPRWTKRTVFPRYLLGNNQATLGQVQSRLSRALRSVDRNFDSGLFSVPGGFAMLASLERIDENARPLAGKNRWIYGELKPGLTDYIGRLFFEQPAYFRVLAFVVTSQDNFSSSRGRLPSVDRGGRILPKAIRNKSFQGRTCHVLVYSFVRRDGPKVVGFDKWSADVHLDESGILSAIR